MERKIYGRDIITVCFTHGGDLGVLQQKTKDNIETIKMLNCFDIIDTKEAEELKEECMLYFQEELKKAAERPWHFLP